MAIALVAHTGAQGPAGAHSIFSGSLTITTPGINTSTANLIVIAVGWATISGGSLVLTDSKGNTWTPLSVESTGFEDPTVQLYYCFNPTVGAGHTFTWNVNPGPFQYNDLCINVAAFSGLATSPFDTEVVGTPGSSATFTMTITPSSANSLIVFAVDAPTSVTTLTTSAGTITDLQINGNTYPLLLGYYIQSGTGAFTPTITMSTATAFVAYAMAVFKGTASSNTSSYFFAS